MSMRECSKHHVLLTDVSNYIDVQEHIRNHPEDWRCVYCEKERADRAETKLQTRYVLPSPQEIRANLERAIEDKLADEDLRSRNES